MKKIVIVGGGISGLTTAYLLARNMPDIEVTVLEADSRPGGKIWTERVKRFLCEKGPNGFLDNKPKTLELCRDLGIAPVQSNANAKKRYILSGGKLNALPESPLSFIMSNILSVGGKLRLLMELKADKGPADETVAEFIMRRLGKEALEKLIDPMCSGIYAGDPYNMSIRHCFPRIKELEQEYGSLIRAMIQIKKERKREAAAGGEKVSAAPGGTLTSFRDGAQTITDALSERLGGRLRTDAQVKAVEKDGGTYQVHTSNETLDADIVIIASPAYAAAEMLIDLDRGLSKTLSGIPYPHVAVVSFGFKKEYVKNPLNGFGFLVPHIENLKILGNLWDSSIFPNRAPEGTVLLRTMLGGAKHPVMEALDDDKISEIVFDELKPVLGLMANPDMTRVYRWHKAIPQYVPGHGRTLEIIGERLKEHPGLYLTGNAYKGIGINDCVENAYRLAEELSNSK